MFKEGFIEGVTVALSHPVQKPVIRSEKLLEGPPLEGPIVEGPSLEGPP